MRKFGRRAYAPGDAVTVKVEGGEVTAQPGPRVDADEQVIGFDLMEAGSIEELVDVVSRHPMAVAGRVEIRPLYDDER